MKAALETRNLIKRFGGLMATDNVTFRLEPGARHALIGPNGAGKTTLINLLTGVLVPTSGTVLLEGKPIAPQTTKAAKQLGIAYLSENRRATIFPRHEIFKNITLAHLDEIVGSFIRQPREIAIATDLVKRTGVRPPSPTLAAGNLSGGNQQKVVLAKWLTVQPKVLILNEPTRGMDVGAKEDVIRIVKSLRDRGVAILVLSTEPETILTLADRVTVIKKGMVARQFAAGHIEKADLLAAA